MNTEAFLDALLKSTSSQQIQAMLRQRMVEQQVDLVFFEALKARSLLIAANDPRQQQKLEQIIQVARLLADDTTCQAMGAWAASLAAEFQGKRRIAIAFTKEALDSYKAAGNHLDYGRVGANLVHILTSSGDHDDAIVRAEEVYAHIKLTADQETLGRLYQNWANAYMDSHRPLEALTLIEKALHLFEQLNSAGRLFFCTIDALPIYTATERFSDALRCFELVEQVYATDPDQIYYWGIAVNHLADYHQQLGRLGAALRAADEAVIINQKLNSDELTLGRMMVRQIGILLRLGQYEQAKISLQSIWPLIKQDAEKVAELTYYQALILQGLGYLLDAERSLQDCVKQFKDTYANWALEAQFSLVHHYLKWWQTTADERYLDKANATALTIYHTLQHPQRPIKMAEALLLLIRSLLNGQQIEQATMWLNHIQAIVSAAPPYIQRDVAFCQGKLAYQRGNLQLAWHWYEQALDHDKLSFALADIEPIQLIVVKRRDQIYRSLLEITQGQQTDIEAFWQYSEESRAFQLTSELKGELLIRFRQQAISHSTQDALIDELYQQRRQLHHLTGRYHDPNQSSAPDEQSQKAELRQSIRKRTVHIKQLSEQIQAGITGILEPQHEDEVLTIEEVTAALSSKTTLIVYTYSQQHYVVTVLQSHGVTAQIRLPTPAQEIHRQLNLFLKSEFLEFKTIWDGQEGTGWSAQFDRLVSQTQHRLKQLYDMLWQPLLSHVPLTSQVVIVPDQLLYDFPFQSLYDGQQYLIDQYDISYAPNGSIYALCKQRALARQERLGSKVVLLGYQGKQLELPYVEEELHAIQQIYPQAVVLRQNRATLKNLSDHVSDARIVHLATHGSMTSQNPYLAYLELAPDQNSPYHNTHLRLYDAAGLDLQQTDFVCLSACETARVSTEAGGLLGLQWGFMRAGANTIIANLWQVEDQAAALLMGLFYQLYQPKRGKSIALQEAQQQLRKRGEAATTGSLESRFMHPYFWAPFASYGFSHSL